MTAKLGRFGCLILVIIMFAGVGLSRAQHPCDPGIGSASKGKDASKKSQPSAGSRSNWSNQVFWFEYFNQQTALVEGVKHLVDAHELKSGFSHFLKTIAPLVAWMDDTRLAEEIAAIDSFINNNDSTISDNYFLSLPVTSLKNYLDEIKKHLSAQAGHTTTSYKDMIDWLGIGELPTEEILIPESFSWLSQQKKQQCVSHSLATIILSRDTIFLSKSTTEMENEIVPNITSLQTSLENFISGKYGYRQSNEPILPLTVISAFNQSEQSWPGLELAGGRYVWAEDYKIIPYADPIKKLSPNNNELKHRPILFQGIESQGSKAAMTEVLQKALVHDPPILPLAYLDTDMSSTGDNTFGTYNRTYGYRDNPEDNSGHAVVVVGYKVERNSVSFLVRDSIKNATSLCNYAWVGANNLLAHSLSFLLIKSMEFK